MKLNDYRKNVSLRKCLLIMKMMIYLMVVAVVQVYAADVAAQKVNYAGQNVSLKEVLTVIEKQTGFLFFYDETLLDDAIPVTVNFSEKPVNEVMDEICAAQDFTWSVEKQTITLVPKPKPVVQEVTVSEPAPLPLLPPITGKVTEESGNPLFGASVFIKGTTIGTTTDDNGNFSITAKKGDVLVVSFVGYSTKEVLVGDGPVTVLLKLEISGIDEVQIIGYGTTTKRLSTGTVATIKAKQIETRPVNNVMQALQGQVAGVAITNFSPGIGSPLQVLIRGANSITSGTNPLIIIDGVVINESPGGLIGSLTGGGSGGANTYQQGVSVMNNINPNDIESVDILKDADATSIYGSRGTNGVILITTKKASVGKLRVLVNVSTGWKSAIGITPRMNTEQYLKMRKDAFATGNITGTGKLGASGNPDPAGMTSVINPITPTNTNAPDLTLWSQTAYTDYSKFELGNPAPNYNFDATISGGTKAMNYLASAGYYRMYDTYMFKPYQERLTSRMQINSASADNRFNMHLSTILGVENQSFSTTNFSNVMGQANINPPNFEMTNPDGSWNFAIGKGYTTGFYYNPLPNEYIKNNSKTNNLLASGELSYEIIKGLVAKAQASYTAQANEFHQIYPSTAVNVQNQFNNVPSGDHTTNKFTSLNMEPQLTYTKTISKANVSALAGATFLDKKINRTAHKVTNPGSDDLLYSYSSGKPTDVASDNLYEKFQSVFGRLSFDWDKKYIANFTFRRDGSSRFSPKNRYANFGSAGFAWIFTSEPFMKSVSFLSHGKLRGSYGTTGNNNIGDYLYLGLLQASSSTLSGSYAAQSNKILNLANYPNEGIKWESTAKTDVGFELGFFKNRILINGTWYRTLSDNLLVSIPLPVQTGFASYTGNFAGVVQNTGQELELTTQNLSPQSPIRWSTRFNITHNANILKEFPGTEKTTYATKYQVGRALPSTSLGSMTEMPYHFTGIDPATGLPQFKDVTGDGIVNSSDYGRNNAWWGTSQPTIWGGLNNTVGYKGFTLDVFLQYSNGIFTNWGFYNTTYGIGSMFNPAADVVDNYWMKPGDVKKYPRLYTNIPGVSAYTTPITQQYPYSSALLYKGYYIRLKNVQLTYTIPENWVSKIGLASASVYVTGENLAVYTPVKLYKDPEVFWGRSNGLLRTITIGVRIEF